LDPIIHPNPNADTSALIRTTSRNSRLPCLLRETRRLSGIGIANSLIFRGVASDVLIARCAWVSINLAVALEETSARLSISKDVTCLYLQVRCRDFRRFTFLVSY